MRTLFFLFLLPFLTLNALANEVITDRYTLTEPSASAEQKFPLIEVKSITIPGRAELNIDAVDVLISGTGYKQAARSNRSEADLALMQKPLAQINREFINMTIHEMLIAIAGIGYAPVIDPINRLIAFEKTNEF